MKKNILIIDDDPSIVELLTLFLKENESNVKSGNTAESGLALARKQEFDLILLDIMLPDSNSVDAIKNLQKIVPQTPVLLITGGSNLEIAKQCLLEGAVDYITKPFDFEYLHTTVIANMLGA